MQSRLSAEQLESFERDGYVVAPGLYRDLVEDLIRYSEEVTSAPEVPGKYMMYFENSKIDGSRIISRIEDFIPYHDGFRVFCEGVLRADCSALFAEDAVLFKDKINHKLAGGEGYKPHQDSQAGWLDYAPLHITAMVALDSADAGNGRLEVVAGRHKEGLIGPLWEPMSEETCADMDWLGVDCQPGDAIFFDSFAPHRSGPNLSDTARRILYITYNKLSDGDHRRQYYADKRANYPPDIERSPDKEYSYKV